MSAVANSNGVANAQVVNAVCSGQQLKPMDRD